MRTITLLFSALVLGTIAHAQTVATFEDLVLSKPYDTFYVNNAAPGADVGFNDGLAHFPCVFDTSFGYSYWSTGFVYSDMADSITSGSGNEFAAKPVHGHNASAEYVVGYCFDPLTFENTTKLKLIGAAVGNPLYGFYVTNNTYAYNSMRDGDAFAHKFHSGDWFMLTIKGYSGGSLKSDSVTFYLADFRFSDTTQNYILKTWEWVDLSSLGHVDSIQFHLTSSDNGSFGMNTPAYFCMDDLTTDETTVSVNSMSRAQIAKVYPNPASDMLYVDIADNSIHNVIVMDMTGKIVGSYAADQKRVAINTASLPSGTYMLQLTGNGKTASAKFVKQ